MPGSAVLTRQSVVQCGQFVPPNHAGDIALNPPGLSKLSVAGALAIVAEDIQGALVAGGAPCATPVTPGGNKPCVSVSGPVTAGGATKLTVSGRPVLLSGQVVGTTDGVPPGTLFTQSNQTKLFTV